MKCQLLVSAVAMAMVFSAVDSRTVSSALELTSDGVGSDSDATDRSAREVRDVSEDKTSSKSVEERAIDHQVEQLKLLKCKPHLEKIYVKDQLEETDKLKEENLIPQILAVKRCLSSCSYCGNDLGMEMKKCVAVKSRMKTFTVRYYTRGQPQYLELPVRMDTECQCQNKPPATDHN